MSVSNAQFRGTYPEFGSTAFFPDPQVDYWLQTAALMLNEERWGTWYDLGISLYAAHNLSIERTAIKEGKVGNAPGAAKGVQNSGSVDKVSYGFDTTTASEEGGGHWNLTIYGQRLYRMIKMVGAGPIQVQSESLPNVSAAAWAGPLLGW